MVKHVILWTLKDEVKDKDAVRIAAKEALEALVGKIEGLVSLNVNINPMASSNVDMMLDSEFMSQEALQVYANHPAHVFVADTYVRPYTASRSCIDYEI